MVSILILFLLYKMNFNFVKLFLCIVELDVIIAAAVQHPIRFIPGVVIPVPLQPTKNIADIKTKTNKK